MLSRFYGAIIEWRNTLYDKGVLKSFSLGVSTVSIGNITVGGTGKTPLVARAAELLFENGEKICILSRGYGRADSKKRVLVSDGEKILADARQSGDEPFELAQKLLGKAIVVADANRVSAGSWAREKFGITAFILDDAFQHRRARRDLDIVTIDATNPFGSGKLLPTGILREPLKNLRRADVIVITRANLCAEKQVAALRYGISKRNSQVPVFVSKNKIVEITKLEEFTGKAPDSRATKDKARMLGEKALAFCALGNPENFFEQLRSENFDLTATRKFPDHHFYTQRDIEKVEKLALRRGAEILLTTAKDAVKLKGLRFNAPCFVIETKIIFDDENNFRKLLLKSLFIE